jgi:hypothetical protein
VNAASNVAHPRGHLGAAILVDLCGDGPADGHRLPAPLGRGLAETLVLRPRPRAGLRCCGPEGRRRAAGPGASERAAVVIADDAPLAR